MTTVTVYRSSDASAPVLTGTAGTLTALLDACLVNGYSGQTAAGWTKPFAGTNQGVYKNSAVDGTGFSLFVNDNGPGAGLGREARVCGFEVPTALGTGTGQFPTIGQLAIGIGQGVIRKSNTADTVARNWTLIADDTVFYLFAETGDYTAPVATMMFIFGDVFSNKSADPYRCAIVARNQENLATYINEPFPYLLTANATLLNIGQFGHFMARSWTGVGGSVMVGKTIDFGKMGAFGSEVQGVGTTGVTAAVSRTGIGVTNNTVCFPYPNGPDQGLYLSPIWMHHNSAVRGYYKGLWAPLHNQPLNHNDTYSGTGAMAGKTFLSQSVCFAQNSVATSPAQVHIETSSTWS